MKKPDNQNGTKRLLELDEAERRGGKLAREIICLRYEIQDAAELAVEAYRLYPSDEMRAAFNRINNMLAPDYRIKIT